MPLSNCGMPHSTGKMEHWVVLNLVLCLGFTEHASVPCWWDFCSPLQWLRTLLLCILLGYVVKTHCPKHEGAQRHHSIWGTPISQRLETQTLLSLSQGSLSPRGASAPGAGGPPALWVNRRLVSKAPYRWGGGYCQRSGPHYGVRGGTS